MATSNQSQYANQVTNPTNLLNDQKFPNAQTIKIATPQQIFALSDEMKQVVNDVFIPERSSQNKAKQLIKHLFSASNVGLAYQSNANLTASEAYKSKVANCMSLTIMAYALAKEAGLNVEFQDVDVPEYWVRNGQYNMLTGHVNLLITGVKQPGVSIVWSANSNIEVDFDPFVKKKSFPKTKINKNTVVAMFYNNKGAEALVNEDYDAAYRYFTAAIDVAPKYAASWANLGILYRFTNQLNLAEKSYQYSLYLNPESLNTMTNLSILMSKQGRYEEARHLDAAILRQRIKNPYYHALLADEAFYAGNFQGAVRHYQRAIELNSNIHEFYFGLAKIFSTMGRTDSAKLAMKKALNINKTPDIERTYIAKLNLLNQE
ncbi:tetratricopeptide repeat protein [Colwellia sp. MEBiC06753]